MPTICKKATAYLFGNQYEFDYIGEVMYDWKLMFFSTAEGYVSAVFLVFSVLF